MMETTSIRSRATAKRLVEKYGREVNFVKLSSVPIDPSKPYGANVETRIVTTQKAVFDDFKIKQENGEYKTITGMKKLITFYSVDFDGYSLVEDGQDFWKIDNLGEVKPGENSVIYQMALKI